MRPHPFTPEKVFEFYQVVQKETSSTKLVNTLLVEEQEKINKETCKKLRPLGSRALTYGSHLFQVKLHKVEVYLDKFFRQVKI